MKKLSVIIVSYNNLPVLINCIESIIKYNDIGESLEVIVVEQSNTTEIYDYFIKNYPKVKTVRNDNKGFGSGNNFGANLANSEYLLFLNPDTLLVEPIFKYSLNQFEKYKDLALFGIQLLDKEFKNISSFDIMIPYGFINKLIAKLAIKSGIFLSSKMYIQGADLFMRKSYFDNIGRFDENIFMYCEESDICLRIININGKIKFFKTKRLIHLEGQCSDISSSYAKQLNSFIYVLKKKDKNYKKYIKSEIRLLNFKIIFNFGDIILCKEKLKILNKVLIEN